MKENITKFHAQAAKWGSAYRWQAVSYFGIKHNGRLVLLAGRILLAHAKRTLHDPLHFETRNVVAGSSIVPFELDSLTALISSVEQGELQVNGTLFHLAGTQPPAAFSTSYYPYYNPTDSQRRGRMPSLLIDGESKHQLLANLGIDTTVLEWELRSADKPYENLDDLLTDCGLPTVSRAGDRSRLELLAATPATLSDDSCLTGGIATIRCQLATALPTKDLKVGYREWSNDTHRFERGRLDGEAFTWLKLNDDVLTGTTMLQLGDVALVQTFLTYADDSLQQQDLADGERVTNPRLVVYKSIDPNLAVLEPLLFESAKDQDSFEAGMSLLLSIIGFGVAPYCATSELSNGPDMAAFTPNGHVLVVECTTEHLNVKGKLSKLERRTATAKGMLQISGFPKSVVQAVVVTALGRQEVMDAHLQEAAEMKIAVLCKEDLQSLLTDLSSVPDADRVFEHIKQAMPSKRPQGLALRHF